MRLLESTGGSPLSRAHLARWASLLPSFHLHTSLQPVTLKHYGRKPRVI